MLPISPMPTTEKPAVVRFNGSTPTPVDAINVKNFGDAGTAPAREPVKLEKTDPPPARVTYDPL